MREGFSVIPVGGIPEIKPGDDLVAIITRATRSSGLALRDGDVVVVASKIVSKAEDRFVKLSEVEPAPFAYGVAKALDKDPRIVELILRETLRVVKMERGKLIVENMHGVICANAGVDLSNVTGGDVALLLPEDPDASARNIHQGLRDKLGVSAAVIITDTVGRPWGDGLVQVAIGWYGIDPVRDYRGSRDSMGMSLEATIIAQADELASAAGLLFGKTEGIPVVLIRRYEYEKSTDGARKLLRKPEDDLFR